MGSSLKDGTGLDGKFKVVPSRQKGMRLAGCSKTPRYKAPEIPRSETYSPGRRNDRGVKATP